jgi:hypothetical protein
MKNKTSAHLTRSRVLLFIVTLLFVGCVGLVGSSVSVHADLAMARTTTQQTAPAAPRAAAQPTPAEKTVEQVQKNIQVLNGLPASQLVPVMNYMGSSLGVKCTFCHLKKGDDWDFVSDEKPEKGAAREMIKMTQGINKANFKGNPAVGCFTCHRGHDHPVRVPQLPIAAPTPFFDSVETPAASKETPPTADQILAKYTEALGGSATIEKLKTRSMKGTFVTSGGITLGYELQQTAPDKVYMILNTPRQGMIERGFDGQIGWEKSGRGIRELHDEELFVLRRYPDLFKDIKLQGQFARLSFGGKETIDGKEVFVLRGMGIDGKGERLYFDTQSGLLLRRVTSTPTVVGLIPEQVDYDDYREVDGMKLPFTIRINSIDSFWSSTRKFTEIKLNTPVDEKKFTRPAATPAPAASPKP